MATNFEHRLGCPLRRPELYNLDEHPLECRCNDLEDEDWDDLGPDQGVHQFDGGGTF